MQEKHLADKSSASAVITRIPNRALEQQLTYWTQRLANAPVLLELLTDFPRPATQTFHRAHHRFALGKELGEGLRRFGNSNGADLNATLLAGFSILLSRYSGQVDLSIGAIAGREVDGLLGRLTNTLVMRSDLSGNPDLPEFLQRTRHMIEGAYAHNDLPFEYLVDALSPVRSLSHAPLTQVGFIFQPPANPLRWLDGANPSARFDVTLWLHDDDDLTGEFHYNSDLFRSGTIERMTGNFLTLLRGMQENPTRRIAELPLLTETEHRQIVVDWNATEADCPDACVHELFERQVEKTPNAPAVILDEQCLTYAELNAKANQLAHYLIEQGVGPDMLIGLCAKRSVEMVIGLLGILKAGGAYVPLDPAYPADRLTYMIKDSQPALLLSQEALLGQLQHEGIRTFCLDRDWPLLAESKATNPAPRALPQTLAYVIYTSGSTGKPKGVMLAHKGLCNLCLAQARAFDVDATSQVLQFASISFDAAVSETFVTLTQGACLHLVRQEVLRSSYEIMKLLEKSAISVVTLPPSLLAVLPQKPLPSLKTLVLAGEAWSPELAKVWAGNRRLLNAYGPTEATVCATWTQVEITVEHTVPIGRPLSNTTIYILDEHLMPTPIGVAGEIYIGGIGLARGYLNRPELTAERFVANPFSHDAGARLYRTGDKARYLADGNIEFLGRFDHQVKLRGYRIELGEIEAALTAHNAVRDAAAIVREDYPGEQRLVAYVVGEQTLNAQILKTHLKASLPEFMLPQTFVFLDAMPLSPNGKLDRKALPLPAAVRRKQD